MLQRVTLQHDVYPEVMVGAFVTLLMLLIVLIVVGLTLLIRCRIFHKTGHGWAFGLLMLVPLANIIMLFVLAFSDWPIHKQLRLFKQQLNSVPAQS